MWTRPHQLHFYMFARFFFTYSKSRNSNPNFCHRKDPSACLLWRCVSFNTHSDWQNLPESIMRSLPHAEYLASKAAEKAHCVNGRQRDGWRWDPDSSASAQRTATAAIYHLPTNVKPARRRELNWRQSKLCIHSIEPSGEVWFLQATGSSLLSEACIYKWEPCSGERMGCLGGGKRF